jgi:type IV fimbrial biogenesis protein FimT
MHRSSGFTLMELIVTLALAAIVLTLGVPSFQNVIRDDRLATRTNDFVAALQLTRSEAIKRGVRVTLCKSVTGTSCANSGGYEQGWIVFIDPNNNATVDEGEAIIRIFEAFPAGANMTLTGNTPVARYVSFIATGTSQLTSGAFQAGTLTLCQTPKARQLVINNVGRVRTVVATCS